MSSERFEGMVAERRLTLITENAEVRDILVRIGKPEQSPKQSPDHTDFSCAYQIVGRGDGRVRRIYGVDAFQSLQLTLRLISTLLNHYRQEANGRMYWQEPGDDMGFPNVEQAAL